MIYQYRNWDSHVLLQTRFSRAASPGTHGFSFVKTKTTKTKIQTCRGQITLSKTEKNLSTRDPKPGLHNIIAQTKFDENHPERKIYMCHKQ